MSDFIPETDPYLVGDADLPYLLELGFDPTIEPTDVLGDKIAALREYAAANLWTKRQYMQALVPILNGDDTFRDPTQRDNN